MVINTKEFDKRIFYKVFFILLCIGFRNKNNLDGKNRQLKID